MLQELLNNNNIKKKGVIHIGAHMAEEIQEYINCGIKNVLYIEANYMIWDRLLNNLKEYADKINIAVYLMAISDNKKNKSFYVTSNIMSSSLYKLNYISKKDGLEIDKIKQVKCETLDYFIEKRNIDMNDYNILNIDTQGSEYDIISKADKTLKYIDYIKVETFKNYDYADIKLHDEVVKLIESKGFKMIEYEKGKQEGTGDVNFIKEK